MAFCKLLSLLVLIHNTGDLLGAKVSSCIVGGNDAAKGSWPWMAHLNFTSSDGKTEWRCGGTILSDQWVLTAAHCWDRNPTPDYHRSMVWVGSHALKKGAVRYMGIKYFISHPQYQNHNNRYVNDIALIQVKKKMKFSSEVKPVSLPSVDDTFGTSSECWITGWGYTGTNAPLRDPETLQQLKINIVSQTECKRKYPDLTSDMLCAGGEAGKDACQGDYGGPLVCRSGDKFVQVGIMSYGNPGECGVEGHPGIYTQVSRYLSFISYINQTK